MPHQLRHGPTIYNGRLRGPVTLTPVAERFYDLGLSYRIESRMHYLYAIADAIR